MPLKAATVNIRGLNGENGITKRQHIVRVMKEERLDILLLTETQVNTSSVDTLDDYVFFFSSDIQPGKSDREHSGVGIVIHRRLKPFLFLFEIKQTSGRLMAMRLRSIGANMAFIYGYAPHSGHPTETKEASYDSLQDLSNECNEAVFIGGDFNARLHYRYSSEHDIIGAHTFGRGRQYLEHVAHSTLENRSLFVDFCGANSLRVLNTDYQKPLAKQATVRENTARIGHAFSPETHAQLDFWLARQKQRNHCKEVQSRTDIYLNTDHYMVEIKIRVKLAATPRESRSSIPKNRKPTQEQWVEYNRHMAAIIQCDQGTERWKAFNCALTTAALHCLSKETPDTKKDFLSKKTWDRIYNRQRLYLEGRHQEVLALDRQIKERC